MAKRKHVTIEKVTHYNVIGRDGVVQMNTADKQQADQVADDLEAMFERQDAEAAGA